MTTYDGNGGSVSFDASTVVEITDWTLDAEVDILDDTVMGDNWETKKGGRGKWSGSASGYLDYDGVGQGAIIADLTVADPPGTAVAGIFVVATGKTFTGSMIASGFSVSQPKDGIVTVSFNFVGTGALAMTWT